MRGTTRLLGNGEVNLNSSQPSPSSSSPNRRAFRGGPRSDAARPPRHTDPVPEPASRPPADLHARPPAPSPSQRLDCARGLVVVVYTSTCLPCPLLLSPIRPALQKPEKLPSPRKKLPHLTRSRPSPPVSVRRRRSREPPANRGYLLRRAISAVLCHGGTGTPRAALSGSPSLSKFSCPLAVGIRLSPRFR